MFFVDTQVSMFNHSCDPNCYIAVGEDGTMVVKTKKNVAKDDELCISCIFIGRIVGRQYNFPLGYFSSTKQSLFQLSNRPSAFGLLCVSASIG